MTAPEVPVVWNELPSNRPRRGWRALFGRERRAERSPMGIAKFLVPARPRIVLPLVVAEVQSYPTGAVF